MMNLQEQLQALKQSLPEGVTMRLHDMPVGQRVSPRATVVVLTENDGTPDLSFLQVPGYSAIDHYEEPPLTRARVHELINALPQTIGTGLRERLNAVLCAEAPQPFSDALGELEAYLAGLDDAGSLPFDQQILLKAYVMTGWKAWRAGLTAREV